MTVLTLSSADQANVRSVHVIEQIELTAAVALQAGAIFRLDSTGKAARASAASAGTADARGITTRAVAAGERFTGIVKGILDLGDALNGAAWDAVIYLADTATSSAAAGELADAAGTSSKVIGQLYPGQAYGLTPNKLLRINL